MVTCLVDQLDPEVGLATTRLLSRLGVDVEFPDSQTCCGQAAWNSGFAKQSRTLAEHTIGVFEGYDHVVTPSGSCGGMIHHGYQQMFRDDRVWLERARDLASRTFELSQYIVDVLGTDDVGATYSGTATYHPSCHAKRILGVGDQPERLLSNVEGLTVVPLPRAEDCCGFGGSFAVKLSDLSASIVGEKVQHVESTAADTLISTDAGCLLNMRTAIEHKGLPVRVMHLAQVLESTK